MSDGAWLIFVQRPIALVLLSISTALLALAAWGTLARQKDWRTKLVEADARQSPQEKP
jgi:TctA family transporter